MAIRPRSGTIVKNHIQSRYRLLLNLLFLSALNMILHLRIIIAGAILMVINIVRYSNFLRTTHDVISSGSKRDKFWKYMAQLLLVFFLIGYIFIALFSRPDFMMSQVLFWEVYLLPL